MEKRMNLRSMEEKTDDSVSTQPFFSDLRHGLHQAVVRHGRPLKWGVFLFPLLFFLLMAVLKFNWYSLYYAVFIKEDGLTENATAIFYFVSCLVSFRICMCFYKENCKILFFPYLVLAAFFFFVGMEEISWGQRLFGMETPEILEKYNVQNEMNLHNLIFFPIHWLTIIAGLYGGLARRLLPKSIRSDHRAIVNYFTPDDYLIFYFLIVAVLFLYIYPVSQMIVPVLGDSFAVGLESGVDYLITTKDQEPAEFLLSMGFFLFVLVNRFRQKWDRDGIFWTMDKAFRSRS